MFFDILKSEESILSAETDLYNKCIECEKKVRIDPEMSVAAARIAGEAFLNTVLLRNGIEIPDTFEERREAGLSTIVEKINMCLEKGFLNEKQVKGLTFIRKGGNNVIHILNKKTGTPSEIFRAFYISVASYAIGKPIYKLFEQEKRNAYTRSDKKFFPEIPGYETEDFLPIGDYEVIRPMFDYRTPESEKIRAYRCKKISRIEGREEIQYAIIKRFKKNSIEDIRQYRDIVAINEIKRSNANLMRLPIIAEEISTSVECEYRYLCYITSENTFLLSHRDELKKYYTSLGCETYEQQVLAQLQILKDVVELLYDLIDIDENKSIHHRNLRPHCIFITPNRRGCKVSIGNFEYSKVDMGEAVAEGNPTLMVSDYAQRVQNDPYAAPEIKRIEERLLSDPDWEQVDVYSAAKLSLYILFGNASEKNLAMQLEALRENMSEEFYTITRDIIENTYPTRPTFKEYLKVIRAEMLRFE